MLYARSYSWNNSEPASCSIISLFVFIGFFTSVLGFVLPEQYHRAQKPKLEVRPYLASEDYLVA